MKRTRGKILKEKLLLKIEVETAVADMGDKYEL